MKEPKYKLRLHVRIEDWQHHSGGLEISEEIELNCETFLEMAQILGQFHALAKGIEGTKK